MRFDLCNGKSIVVPPHLLQFGSQFEHLSDSTSWLAEFLKKNQPGDFGFASGSMSIRKLCSYVLQQKVDGQYKSYMEPLGGAGIDAKLFEQDPTQVYLNDIDMGCLELLLANFPQAFISRLNFFDKKERAKLLSVKPDFIFLDYNEYTPTKFWKGEYRDTTVESFNSAQKFLLLNDCGVHFLQYGKKSYEVYSKMLGQTISTLPEYFKAVGEWYQQFIGAEWHLTDVTHHRTTSGHKLGTELSSYQLFRKSWAPATDGIFQAGSNGMPTIRMIGKDELAAHPMLTVKMD